MFVRTKGVSLVSSRPTSSIWRVVRWCSNETSQPIIATTALTNMSIAQKQQLYMIDPVTPGSIFFLPHGTRIFNKLISFMKNQQSQHGFQEVVTPLIYKKTLWETSGHWDNYKEDMFRVEGSDLEKEQYGLKPMNCPGHCLIFKHFDRSYNELPLRLSDFSSLHRNESSGSLSGLTRVRRFHQDDGHIFCRFDQVEQEISNTLKLINTVYNVFGLPDFRLCLSTRPDNYMGDIKDWNRAESVLKNVLENTDKPWSINEGDGAFYGPKIDILLKDQFGKEHQVATIQLDFQLPSRFELEYKTASEANEVEQPIMIHRAVFGSLERFLALLIDHYEGKWPFWINPRQAVIIPVNESHIEYCEELRQKLSGETHDLDVAAPLTSHKFHIDVDKRASTTGSRIREAVKEKGYSYIIMIGDKETESGLVAIRHRDNRKVTTMSIDEVTKMFVELENSYK